MENFLNVGWAWRLLPKIMVWKGKKKQKSITLKWGKLPNNISAKGLMPTVVNWVGNLCP